VKILLLHAIDDPTQLRRTTLNQTFCMPKYAPGHDYCFHALQHDARAIARERFDAILIDTTFLCFRWARPRQLFEQLLERYDFVRRSEAVKIALPQDDYDHCGVLDRWLSDWNVSTVFTPLARFAEVLYPRTRLSARIEQCLTGYLDRLDRTRLAALARPTAARRIDIGYRARALPPLFGRVGRLKSEVGHLFANALPPGHGLRLDISTDARDQILGERWLDFLGDCCAFLGSASGSSLLDPEGHIKDATLAYLERVPGASFEEVEATCFAGADGRYMMTALGPRNLECAASGTCQILVPDAALEPFVPGEHYLSLDADMRNIDSVLDALRDPVRLQSVANAAGELVRRPGFSYEDFAARLEASIQRPVASTSTQVAAISVESIALAEREVVLTLQRESALHRLTVADADLSAMRTELAATKAELAATKAELAATKAELAATKAELADLSEAVRIRRGMRGALREVLGRNIRADMLRSQRKEI
jgi:hypothetical protein